jgi:phosphate transport system permease protein
MKPSSLLPSRWTARRIRWTESVIEAWIRISGFSAVFLVLAILFFIFREAFPVLGRPGFSLTEFLGSVEWYPTSAQRVRYGALGLLVGTASVTGVSLLISVPAGLGAAIFLSEFCTGRTRETLKVVIELLAAIPSVVWGFIGLTVMSQVLRWATPAAVGVNLLNGALILSLMSLPVIVSLTEDALRSVPDSHREAAEAMGATRWQLTWRVLLPGARHGILAAVLLGTGRAVGETMAVLMATGNAVNLPTSLLDPVRTLTANIAAELGEAPAGSDHYRVLFLTGVLLFGITLVINLLAEWLVRGGRKGR